MSSKPPLSHLQFMTARELVDHLDKEKSTPMTITYFQATRCISVDADDEQITTLASGDDDADVKRLSDHARKLGWPLFSIRKWISDTSGHEREPDGKDVYRHHQGRLIAVPPP